MESMLTSAPPLDSGLEREVMAARVADTVRNDILAGALSFGQKLKEADLARRFNVSHNVVREAIHILQGEGIVVAHPYRGRYVFDLTADEAQDLLLARTSLEALAAFLAASRMTPEAAEDIRSRAGAINPAKTANYLEWVQKELSFHRAVWKAASDRWLLDQLNRFTVPFFAAGTTHYLQPEFNIAAVMDDVARGEREHVESTHEWLAGELLSGDPERARQGMIVHLMRDAGSAGIRKKLFNI